jgi:biopolymer transport protein ExbD
MRRTRRLPAEVELNFAAMLDMAFQLLAFFILTFRPSPIESQFLLHLPPAVPVTNVQAPANANDPAPQGNLFAEKVLTMRLLADPAGRLASVRLELATVFDGPANAANLALLDERLKQLFGIENGPYEQVFIRVDSDLQYEDFMKVLDVCQRQRLPDGQALKAINFAELSDSDGAK